MGIFDFFKKKKISKVVFTTEIGTPKDKDELHKKFMDLGLDLLWEKVSPFVRNSILMALSPLKEESIKVGSTKFGGSPDLPRSAKWPFRGDKALSFIAQINFAEVKPFDLEDELPFKGILYLFYDLESQDWGFDIKDKDGFATLFYDGDLDDIVRTNAPTVLGDELCIPSASVTFDTEANVPGFDSVHFKNIDGHSQISDDEWDRYFDNFSHDNETHKLLGHSDNIQNGMEDECQLVTKGLYCDNAKGYSGQGLRKTSNDWKLLLQIDSSDEQNVMWGDSGRLYLWILKTDLEQKNFSKTWLIQQCY